MTPEMKTFYDAAVAADEAWWEALVEAFGGEAASARYDKRGVSTVQLKRLHSALLAATDSWREVVRQHRTARALAGDSQLAPLIVSVRFTAMPVNAFDPVPEVWATFEDGEEKLLFSYYPDEISFMESEFICLTEEQARRLRHERDVDYLRQ